MKKFFIAFPAGCCRRQLDCNRIVSYFEANHVTRAANADEADYVIVSTCGLTQLKEDRSIEAVRHHVARHGDKTYVYGCVPAMNSARLESVFSGISVTTKEIGCFGAHFPELPVQMDDVADANTVPDFIPRTDRQAEFDEFFSVRISEGCLGNCSYCTIRQAIGSIRSKPLDAVLQEIRAAVEQQQYRINLAASDSGAYGLDIGSDFPTMLRAILGVDHRLIIAFVQDLNPRWLVQYRDDLCQLVGTGRIECMLTPVQSGSPRILALMNRSNVLGAFQNTIRHLKEVNPDLTVWSQIIVGFPAEQDHDHEMTIEYLRELDYHTLHVFLYHETANTISRTIQPKVPHEVKVRRAEQLQRCLQGHGTIMVFP